HGGTQAPELLREKLDKIVEGEQARSAFWGIYIQDLDSGQILYRRNEDKRLIPASNQKLLTTAAALEVLGSDYRYTTTLHVVGQIQGSVLRGDLILEGSGDPTFGSRRVGGDDPLKKWAEGLVHMGVTRIEGRIIGDDDVFDDGAYARGWDVAHIATESFAPARGGLSYHDNMVQIRLEATSVGEPPVVRESPPGYFEIRNQLSTSPRRRRIWPRVERRVGTDAVRLHGMVPRAYRGTLELPVSDPTAFTLHAFLHALREAGIEVAAPVYDVDALGEKPDYEQARPLFTHVSPPLSEIINVINKRSDNLYAEQVFHTLAWGGESGGGTRRVKEVLVRLGIPAAEVSARDGSGLSRKDLVTPEAMGRLLARMYAHEDREVFLASLARGGEPKTTLEYRLRGVPVLAKTGSLEYVRTLSGYATTPDGRTVAFVLLANNYTAPAYRINRAIDSMVLALTTTQVG
ncbi:MAG: D-alanyl-D-alanine carboxypeptidase/D-alanyl-D-alanine-endopeptidase, partial [Rhodothermales bacterium]